ncbi:unnamed protein product [Vicia faba]|uniref:Uncharacterized protein n=1 Tax=Vicia faba TaxID=3906 RepID=A0AAV0ZXS9_VICFA|nr:unnamed protein product [Vicia faba]
MNIYKVASTFLFGNLLNCTSSHVQKLPKLKTYSLTLGILILLATFRNYLKCRLGSSFEEPEYCPVVCSIWNIIGSNSNSAVVIFGNASTHSVRIKNNIFPYVIDSIIGNIDNVVINQDKDCLFLV